MNKYKLTRARNIRIYETVYLEFPSDEEAIAAAREAHKNDPVGYNGKAGNMVEEDDVEECCFVDLTWKIDRLGPKSPTDHALGLLPVTSGFESLKQGYVTASDIYNVLEQLADLDLDWPPHMRRIRALWGKLYGFITNLKLQSDYE